MEKTAPAPPGLPAGAPALWLAPLAGWTDAAFRDAIRPLGGLGLAVTEVVSARSLRSGHRRSWALVERSETDRPLAVQLSAATIEDACEAARRLEAAGYEGIDLNLGCPVRKLNRKGRGAALARAPEHAAQLAAEMSRAVRIPVTAKIRLGWEDPREAPALVRALEAAGLAAVTVHGRSRAQGFTGRVDREAIAAAVRAARRMPVIANGDVRTVDDVFAMLEDTGARGVMIGRGAVEDPWLFARAHARLRGLPPPAEPTLAERLAFARRHFAGLLARLPEPVAAARFRKILRVYLGAVRAPAPLLDAATRIEGRSDLETLLREAARRASGARPGAHPPLVPTPARPTTLW